jgi:predicted MPP superfamily phosphohydrolase
MLNRAVNAAACYASLDLMGAHNEKQFATKSSHDKKAGPYFQRRRRLSPPRRMTGKERRWLDPNKGLFKVFEREIDFLVSRFVYPHLLGLWHPYNWLLPRRFSLAEISLSPAGWPKDLARLKVLLLSDIHTGIFLKPQILSAIVDSLMELRPDLVAVAGDLVTGQASDLDGFLPALASLSLAPLGALYCHGNHDYFGGDAEEIRARLRSIGITTLRNESVVLAHGDGRFVLGGIDDRILGKPDWDRLASVHGVPHLLLAHHPDFFYEAEARGVPLTLSGHTHGGQIRFSNGPPLVRHSKFCLDEGAYAYHSSLLVVSRGLGSVGLPWRYGADPEAVMIEITP